MARRYLITGASGFIGQHLAERLVAQGASVRCLVRRSSQTQLLESLGVELARGDLGDRESLEAALQDVDVVCHLAGATAAFSAAEFMRVNREGTENLARGCAAMANPPVHVVISSVAAAGPAPLGVLRSEADQPQPISHYGRSKRAGEEAAEAFADRVPTTVVRPGIVFGPRNRETLPVFKTISRFRVHPVVGWRTPQLSLIHVDDLIELMLQAAERGRRIPSEPSERGVGTGYYFACAPEYPDYAQWGGMVKAALNRPYAPTLRLVGPLPWFAAACSELVARARRRPDNFNLDKIREARAVSWACSAEAAIRDLQFRPPKSLAERIEETVLWYRENGWL